MKSECCRWSLPAVDSCIIDVGWALPNYDRWNQVLVGTAHPTIRNFPNVRDNMALICGMVSVGTASCRDDHAYGTSMALPKYEM